jgi:aerobic-type carbon monoxide dehydrogenase small subunit (CoxS/CutS family)
MQFVAGADVETVESLAGGSHPLLASFVKEQAGQCGYCLSGILMRAKALLAGNPRPSRSDITDALDAHICRCGAHVRIMRAIERAARLVAKDA